MLLDAAVVCLVIGRLAGGRFHRFGELPFRAPWLFAVGFAMQAAAVLPFVLRAAPALRVSSYLVLFAGVAVNWPLWELRVAGVGLLLNFLVITANGGKMPASEACLARKGGEKLVATVSAGLDPRNSLLTERTRLAFLGDRLAVPVKYRGLNGFSAGDVLLTIGVCALILRGMGAFGLRAADPPAPGRP
jgi:hypothetical protein